MEIFLNLQVKYSTVDPPKDSDLPPLEGLGLDSNFRLKNV
eukprot:UN20872